MVLALVPASQAYATGANQPPITVTVNGQLVNFEGQAPIMVENRVLVPVRGVFELMGFTVSWDPDQRIARLTRSDITVVIPAASTSFVVNGVVITPEVPQRMVNNRLLLPLRAVAEAVGGVPNWDAVNRRAMITTPLAPSPTPAPVTPTPTPAPASTPTPLLTAAPRFEGSAGFAMGGNAYMLGSRHANSVWGGGWSHHNLNSRFATLTATIGRLDGSGAGARTLIFIGDGHELARYTVSGYTFSPVNIAVDVRNVTVLRIEIEAAGNDGVSFVLGTPMVHPTQATAPIPTPRPSPGPAGTPVPLLTAAPRVDGSAGFGFGGNAYIQGIRHTGAIWGGGWSTHNLNNRFNTLNGVIGRQDNSGSEARNIRFINAATGAVINTFTVSGTGAAQNISVNVQGVHTLRIEIDSPGTNGVSIVFGNTLLHYTHTATTTPTPLLTAAPRVDGSAGFGFGGNAYMQGIRYTSAIWGGGWSTHNLNNRFTTLTGIIGRQDGSGTEARNIRFINAGTGAVLNTFTVSGTDAPRNITVNVQGVHMLRVEIDSPGVNGVSVVLGNIMVHPTTATATPTPVPATTPAPLLTAAPRVDGAPGFGFGGSVNMNGFNYTGAIWGSSGWSTHNLGGRFTTLTGSIGRQDNTHGTESRTIRFLGDNNRYLASFHVGSTDLPRSISVDVSNVHTLRIEIVGTGTNGVTVVLGVPIVHPVGHVATTPAPLLTAAPRVDGAAGFGFGGNANIQGHGYTSNAFWGGGWSTHNLNGRFVTLTGVIGRQYNMGGSYSRNIRFINTANGAVLGTFTVAAHDAPRHISVNVSGVTTMRVEIDGPSDNGVHLVLGNATVHPTTATVTTPTPTPTPTPAPATTLSSIYRVEGTGSFTHVYLGGVRHENSLSGAVNTTHRLNRQFTTFEATLGGNAVTGSASREVRIYGDGHRLATHNVYGSTFAPRTITVNVANITDLRIYIVGPGTDGVTAALGNPRVR